MYWPHQIFFFSVIFVCPLNDWKVLYPLDTTSFLFDIICSCFKVQYLMKAENAKPPIKVAENNSFL
ncbi:hypothetical protein O3M35_006470 [Rhynocoris fuscipes]|uniref:Uncharacterized protein n=1 Tax=Rhynocoris fuscipes TaxID=488301 RepID=A0AAW1DE64_9HEMI